MNTHRVRMTPATAFGYNVGIPYSATKGNSKGKSKSERMPAGTDVYTFYPTFDCLCESPHDVMNKYHLDVPLSSYVSDEDEEESLLVDPGAHDNLCGSRWIMRMKRINDKYGLVCTERPLQRAAMVGGVGHGVQTCRVEATVPIAMQGGHRAFYRAPVVPESDLPALFGNKSLMRNRALIDTFSGRMWFIGPGDLQIKLPPGSLDFKLNLSKGGHWMLPVTYFRDVARKPSENYTTCTISKDGKYHVDS